MVKSVEARGSGLFQNIDEKINGPKLDRLQRGKLQSWPAVSKNLGVGCAFWADFWGWDEEGGFLNCNIISHGWHRLQEGVLKINVRDKYKTLGNCKRSF